MMDYGDFLRTKQPLAQACGIEPSALPPSLFDYQAHCVEFALRQGRAGIYLDTGLGKTAIELAFAAQAAEASNGRALILTPLAVAAQTAAEAEKLQIGIDARVVRDSSEVRDGVNICNYDRLEKLDFDAFGAVVLDEASILKSFTGKTTRALIDAFAGHRFKMAATATPAPNDHMELGQQSQWLSVMDSNEMLMRWFIADQTQMGRYRLKSHGEADFWDWMASWSRMAQSPEDLGFDGSRFVLPALNIRSHYTAADVRAMDGTLFALDTSATGIHDLKRQTTDARADVIAACVAAEPSEAWVIWCDTDYEADALIARLPVGTVEVRGSQRIEDKESALQAFADGQARCIVTKPSICGFGLNWQHAARMAFVGRSFSYEAWYQSVRRCWRYGQTRPVDVHIAVADGEDQIARVVDRKSADHARMKSAMRAAMMRSRGLSRRVVRDYEPTHLTRLPEWIKSAV